MLLDYHLHTRFSDGGADLQQYAARAVDLGLDEIGVADHCPLPQSSDAWHMAMDDLEAYVRSVEETQQRFPEITIRLGLEMDFVPGAEAFTRELAALHPWDYFLGSVHYVGDFTVDGRAEAWQGINPDTVWRDYFELWTMAARSGLYDSLAHPDLPKKFGYYPKADMTSVIERALGEVKRANMAVEINTSGLRKPCGEIYPGRGFLEMAHRLDIPISLGSDAHHPRDLAADFDQAVAFARGVGYQQLCRFNRRARELVPLD